jgi:FMN phosphatase YigB (HAD superfamily)
MPLASRALVRWDRWTGHGSDPTWAGLVDEVLTRRPEVVTVDIFDTILVRTLVGQDNFHHAVGTALVERGLWEGSVEDFVRARRTAARATSCATIDQIYDEPPLAEGARPGAASVEARLELVSSSEVPGAVAGLDRLRRRGIDVTFLSDMHLDHDTLWAALATRGLARPGDRLVVSCEQGVDKRSGRLHELVRAEGRRVVHLGNDLWHDVAMAEQAGIDALALCAANPTPFEALMASRTGSTGAAVAGAARRARLAHRSADALQDRRILLGADVAGQVLTAFLLWVREQCRDEGIVDVAFLARDGELPLRMARAMPSDHWEGVTLRYLHCTRRAWTLAAAAVVGAEEWIRMGTLDEGSFLHQSRRRLPFSSLLERVALSPRDLQGHPTLRRLDPARPLPADLDDDFAALLADPEVRATIEAAARDDLALIIEHLAAEGITGQPLALVDVGWRGQLAWVLSSVIRQATGQEPVHLHFGGANVAPGVDEVVDIRRFAMDDSVAPLPFDRPVSCLETFTGSGRPRATGFRRSADGRVELDFDRPVPEAGGPAREELWRAAEACAGFLPARSELQRWGLADSSLDAEARRVLTRFWTAPERIDADALRPLGFEADDAGTVIDRLATPYRLGEFVLPGPRPTRQWQQGSLRLTPEPLRAALKGYFALRRTS